MVEAERTIETSEFPINEDLERFKPPYTPEVFTEEEQIYLRPFFTNLDQPVFIAQHLPEIVTAALSARYSRSIKSVRRMFLDEYILPVVNPADSKEWKNLSRTDQNARLNRASQVRRELERMNRSDPIGDLVNAQRAEKFYEVWLAGFGDDSIAELGNVHLFIEGLSNIATKTIEDKRVGVSPLEKSSRYVSFLEKGLDGNYQYVVPGEILGSDFESDYREAMDGLFDTFASVADPYLDYIKTLYPRTPDENEKSFENSRSAKRFDDLRDLLPFATRTNIALSGNGRAYEALVNKLLCHPLGEIRYWGQALTRELDKVVPAFVARPQTERGAQTQTYLRNINSLREEIAGAALKGVEAQNEPVRWAKLLNFTPDADIEILSAFLLSAAKGQTLEQIRTEVSRMSSQERSRYLKRILDERDMGDPEAERDQVRFREVPRAFENADYLFEVFSRGGDYRDLHRHRQQTQERHPFTNKFGYDLESEVLNSPFAVVIKDAIERANGVVNTLSQAVSQDVAQYAVPFADIQHWYMNMSAKEIYWIVELRTGPQGRPHYRSICQQIAKQAMEASPAVFKGMRVDWRDYSLARRGSEIKTQRKLDRLRGSIQV